MCNALSRTFYTFCLLSMLASMQLYAFTAAETDQAASVLQAQLPDVHEKILQIPMENPQIQLQATLYTPDGDGPFPLVVLNHGSSGSAPREQARSRLSFASVYFLSRGYAVVQPMMRGYAGSGGKQIPRGCDMVAISLDNAEDIRRVIDYMAGQPRIDASRVIVGGQSFGGYNTLALGTLNLPNVKGLLNFNGTMRSASCPDDLQRSVNAVGYYAARTRTPTLWFYGSNDSMIPEETWRAAYRRYSVLGGNATLVALGRFKNDSHNFLGNVESLAVLSPPMDTFLQNLGMPYRIKSAGFLPAPTPPASGYAALNDIAAVPANAEMKVQYQRFLTLDKPRAFIIGDQGVLVLSGGINPLARGLANCREQKVRCVPYAVDDQVVWVRPQYTPIPSASGFAALNDVAAVPIDDSARDEYRQFLSLSLPRAFVIGKNMVAAASGGLDPLGKVLQSCIERQQQCWPYAVDNAVVWVNPRLTAPPADSGYADINDVAAVPIRGDSAQSSYRAFLRLPLPRVFVLSHNGKMYSSHGGIDPLGVVLASCQKQGELCSPYAMDNQVVWAPPAEFYRASHFADIRDVDALPVASAAAQQSYRRFLALPKPRAFVLAPDGATGAATGANALARATSQCISDPRRSARHSGCAAYALDDDVVWFAR